MGGGFVGSIQKFEIAKLFCSRGLGGGRCGVKPLPEPAIAGVLYMTEISAAAISSAFWSGEPFGLREISGIALITVAAILESVRDLWRDRRLARS